MITIMAKKEMMVPMVVKMITTRIMIMAILYDVK